MTEFIAEVSSNHNRDLDRCLRFIDVAADIGCHGIKFQLFKVEELFAPEALQHKRDQEGRSLWERREWELPVAFLPKLAQRCRQHGIKFLCTPFYLDAVDELYQYVDAYKVASYEILWHDLLRKIAGTHKPAYLSTGMATGAEVIDAARAFGDLYDLTIMHCVSAYPAPRRDCNLRVIGRTRELLGLKVGWSDHSCDPGVIYRAVHRWDAATVEFHLDLEGEGAEFAYGHCWLPRQIRSVIESCRAVAEMDGIGQGRPALCEMSERDWRADPSDGLRPMMEVRRELNVQVKV